MALGSCNQPGTVDCESAHLVGEVVVANNTHQQTNVCAGGPDPELSG